VLGSSSSGNSTLVMCDGTSILIDVGLPSGYTREMVRRFTGRDQVDAVFISHEHIDHVRSLKSLAACSSVPVHVSSSVAFFLRLGDDIAWEGARDGRPVAVGPMKVTPFIVPHDALEPFGFVVEQGSASLAIMTDLGYASDDVSTVLADRDALIIESNYDRDMLLRGPYPHALKKRIMTEKGHLSNVQCRDVISRSVGPRTKEVVLAHLSEENNDPLLALETSLPALEKGHGAKLHLSYPRTPTPLLKV